MTVYPIVSRGDGATFGKTTREIRYLDDFNPINGVITLTEGHYQIKDTIATGGNRFVFGPGEPFVTFQFDDSFNNFILSTGSNIILFSGNGALRLLHGKGNAFVIEGDNVKFIDVTGSFGALYSFIGFSGTGGSIGDVRGKVVNQAATAGLILREMIIDGWETGITVTNGIESSLRDAGGAASSSATGAFLTVRGAGQIVIAEGSNVVIPSASASFIDIDPTVEIPVSIDRIFISGGGDFFKPSTKSGTFTAVDDDSVGATAMSVTGSSGIARFNFTGPTLFVNQEVVISGFVTNAAEYNGTWIITDTDGTSWFEIDIIDYGSDETGSFLSNSVTLTEASTTVSDGDTILLNTDGSTDYDIGSFVYDKQAGSFRVNAEWSATTTGSWVNGSLTEDNKFVSLKDCGEQTDSKSLSGVLVTGNSGTTSATTGDWVDMNLVAAADSASSSRFKLSDPVNGEVEYTGLNPFNGLLIASISPFKLDASVRLHQFRAIKTVGTPAFETNLSERDLNNRVGNASLLVPVSLKPGDKFKLQIKSVETDTTVTIQNITIAVI